MVNGVRGQARAAASERPAAAHRCCTVALLALTIAAETHDSNSNLSFTRGVSITGAVLPWAAALTWGLACMESDPPAHAAHALLWRMCCSGATSYG